MNSISGNILKSGDLSFYACLLCAAILPVHIHWLPPLMVALAVFRFFERKSESFLENQAREYRNLFFLFLLLFLWQLSGLFFADSIMSGIERMFKRTAFILFPAALYYPSARLISKFDLIMKVFILGIIIYLIFCFTRAFINSFPTVDGKVIFRPYHELYTWESWFTGIRLSGKIHPAYLAMYIMVAVLICLEYFFNPEMERKEKKMWLLAAILLFPVILLLTRSAVIASVIIFPLYFFLKIRSDYPHWILFSLAGLFILVFALLLAFNSRIKYTLEDISREKIGATMENDIRLNIWRSAWGVIKDHPVIGVGTGNASVELKKEFVKRGYSEGFYDDLNAHNQFLEILLENGIIGLLIFLWILAYMVFMAVSGQNKLLFLFVLITIIFFFFESMLNRLAGIMFFPFITFLLIHFRKREAG